MNDERLVDIEVKLAHQEDTVALLNAVVSAQQQRIDKLEALCSWLRSQIRELAGSGGGSADDDVPPHY